MKIFYSSRFKKDYRSLSPEEKKQFKKKAKLMIENLKHPSLRIKKIQGRKGIFETSISMAIRLTWQFVKDGIYLRSIGPHDKTLNNP